VVTATNDRGAGWPSHAVRGRLPAPASSGTRGSGWRDDALGRTRSGSTAVRGDTIRVVNARGDGLGEGDDYKALGRDIEDSLHFVSRTAGGSFTLTTRLDTARGPLTGLMLRDSLSADTRYLYFGADAEGGLVLQNRSRDSRHDWQDEKRSPLDAGLKEQTSPPIVSRH
jgi:hypothetical protein